MSLVNFLLLFYFNIFDLTSSYVILESVHGTINMVLYTYNVYIFLVFSPRARALWHFSTKSLCCSNRQETLYNSKMHSEESLSFIHDILSIICTSWRHLLFFNKFTTKNHRGIVQPCAVCTTEMWMFLSFSSLFYGNHNCSFG